MSFNPIRNFAFASIIFCTVVTPALAQSSGPRQPPAAPSVRPSPGGVSLEELLLHAENHATEIALARAGLSKGRAELEAEAPLFPADPVLGGAIGRRWNRAGSGVDWGVSLEQEIEVAGERGLRRRAARASVNQGAAELAAARWRVHRRLHGAFHAALVARERVRAAGRLVQFSQKLVEVAGKRLSAGETSALPVRLAESDLAEARQARIAAESAFRAERLELADASGWPSDSPPDPSGGLGSPQAPPPTAELLRIAHSRDPELRAREAAVRRFRATLASARRAGFPNPRLGVAFEQESDPGGAQATIWRATLSAPLPLWRGSRPEAVRAQADLDVAMAELGARKRTLGARIRRAAEAVESTARRTRIYGAEVIPTLEKNLTLVEKAFELGEIDITQVLVARERFLRSQQSALNAYEEYHRALGALESAVGTELESASQHAAEEGTR